MKKPKLVMTLLVRDEEDILEKNICFHLSQGVDFIVATDNDSSDKTSKILKKYAHKGILYYRFEPKNTYEQSRWVSDMAKIAVKKFGATHLIHSDADEFWFPKSGNLKSYLPSDNEVFYIPTINYLPTDKSLKSLLGIRTVVANSIKSNNRPKNLESSKYLLYGGYPKIMTSAKFTEVIQGNHDVKGYKNHKSKILTDIFIHHFPVRSYSHFEQKIINGGFSYAQNPNQNPDMGWHWKAWYKLYQQGNLKKEYQKIALSKKEKRTLKKQGSLKDIFIPNRILLAKYYYIYHQLRAKFSL